MYLMYSLGINSYITLTTVTFALNRMTVEAGHACLGEGRDGWKGVHDWSHARPSHIVSKREVRLLLEC